MYREWLSILLITRFVRTGAPELACLHTFLVTGRRAHKICVCRACSPPEHRVRLGPEGRRQGCTDLSIAVPLQVVDRVGRVVLNPGPITPADQVLGVTSTVARASSGFSQIQVVHEYQGRRTFKKMSTS